MELTDFLLARIAEDEAVAQHWPHDLPGRTAGGPVVGPDGHLIRAGRARVLAESEAKRAVVAIHEEVAGMVREGDLTDPELARDARSTLLGVSASLVALARPYADHPDFDPVWAH
jgi:hypothetical protein